MFNHNNGGLQNNLTQDGSEPSKSMNFTYQWSKILFTFGLSLLFFFGLADSLSTIAQGNLQNPAGISCHKDCPGGGGNIALRVWSDGNGNGIQNVEEPGIAGVTVRLLDKTGNILDTATTDANGEHIFSHLDPNVSYIIEFVNPAGTDFSPMDAGSDDTIDSDADPDTGKTDPITVVDGGTVDNVGAGIRSKDCPGGGGGACIRGLVWKDDNQDGFQDPDEILLANITANLWDQDGALLRTTTTGTDGSYRFPALNLGASYIVEFELPNDKLFTLRGNDSDVDATGKSSLVIFSGSEIEINAGLINKNSTIGGTVFKDDDSDGIQDPDEAGIGPVIVHLLDEHGNVVACSVTDSQGEYDFVVDPKQSYVVRVVKPGDFNFSIQNAAGSTEQDNSDVNSITGQTDLITVQGNEIRGDIDAGQVNVPGSITGLAWDDLNKNGIRDVGEPPLAGIDVGLVSEDKLAIYELTTTGSDGTYSFDDINPKLIYRIRFALPITRTFSPQDQGNDDTVDSDVDPDTGQTDPIAVPAGGEVANIDAGESSKDCPGGGCLFFQASSRPQHDRAYQVNDISGEVWNDIDEDGIRDPGESGEPNVTVHLQDESGTILATTTTDASGGYSFPNLDPTLTYVVRVEAPDGTVFSPQDQGGDDTSDSDVDENTGESPSTMAPADIDAGIVRRKDCPGGGCRIVGGCWKDVNGNGFRDAGEPACASSTINLWNEDGILVDSTMTGADGTYQFSDLSSHISYIVEFELPDDKLFTVEGSDSDVDSTGRSQPVNVTADDDIEINAGVINKNATLGDKVFEDADGDGIQDADEAGVAGIAVHLLGQNDNPVACTPTGSQGEYNFGVDPKQPYVIEVVKPSGFDFSPIDALGSTEQNDSDVDPATGQTALITVSADEVREDIDIGLIQRQIAPGDVNCDGKVDTVDGLFILQADIGLRPIGSQYPALPSLPKGASIYGPACDVNNDGICGVVDALFVLRCVIGRPNLLCPGE